MVSAAFPAFMPGPSVGFGKDGIVLRVSEFRVSTGDPQDGVALDWRNERPEGAGKERSG